MACVLPKSMIHLKGLAEDKSKDMLTLVDARQWPLSRNRQDMFAQLSPHTTKNSDITYKEFLRIVAVDRLVFYHFKLNGSAEKVFSHV